MNQDQLELENETSVKSNGIDESIRYSEASENNTTTSDTTESPENSATAVINDRIKKRRNLRKESRPRLATTAELDRQMQAALADIDDALAMLAKTRQDLHEAAQAALVPMDNSKEMAKSINRLGTNFSRAHQIAAQKAEAEIIRKKRDTRDLIETLLHSQSDKVAKLLALKNSGASEAEMLAVLFDTTGRQ